MQVLFFQNIQNTWHSHKLQIDFRVVLFKLMAVLYITYGFIGFGKTTFARNFSIQNNEFPSEMMAMRYLSAKKHLTKNANIVNQWIQLKTLFQFHKILISHDENA